MVSLDQSEAPCLIGTEEHLMDNKTAEKTRTKSRKKELLVRFVGEFKRDEKEYKAVCSTVKRKIKSLLDAEGIMAIVTARVKDPDRLLQKLKNRDTKKNYATREDIFRDIPDLVGARIALYFPSDAVKLQALLEKEFVLQEPPKGFPGSMDVPPEIEDGKAVQKYTASLRKVYPGYAGRRFDGYCATHYRVRLKWSPALSIPDPTIEIQVASVLMHAWSEVEHDLAYKNMMGQVSMEEYEALDEINGLVIAGEVALNRLDRLSQARLVREGAKLSSHFALATYLENWLSERRTEWRKAQREQGVPDEELDKLEAEGKLFALGDAKALFHMYTNGGKKTWDTRRVVKNDLKELDFDPAVPLVIQLEAMHTALKGAMDLPKAPGPRKKAEPPFRVEDPALLGEYLCDWIELQRQLKAALRAQGWKVSGDSEVWTVMSENFDLSEELRKAYKPLYLERNKIIHGNYIPTSARLTAQREAMAEFLRLLEQEFEDQSGDES